MTRKRAARSVVGRGLGPVFALLLSVASAAAQGSDAPAGAIQLRGWAFASLEPGMPEVIPPADFARSAEFVIVGAGPVEVQIVLPEALVSSEGARIPLSYGQTDGVFVAGASATPIRFDPRERQRFVLPANGEAYIYLGTTARPSSEQREGRYLGPITMVVTRPQN